MKNIEDKIQFACCQWLRENKICFFHVPNGGLRSKGEASRLTALGVTPGVHDLVILLPGAITLLIELKKEKGIVSKFQKIFHDKVIKMGFLSHIIQTDCPVQAVSELSMHISHHLQN